MKKKNKKHIKIKRSVPRKILNFFIGVFGVAVFLLIIAVGFMQTNSFRGWLKDEITTAVNDNLNGTLAIGDIEGTIFTSLFINDISLSNKTDTLVKISKFGLKINPVEILLGRIYVRTISLNSPKISFLQDEEGFWPLEKLTNQTEEEIVQAADSVDSLDAQNDSSFPFKIFINEIAVNNLSFVKKTFQNRGAHRKYKIINTDDLEIDSLYFSAKIAADLNKKSFQLLIEKLSGVTNTKSFRLRNLSGAFVVRPGFAQVAKLNILTDSSDISISAQMEGINLFEPLELESFKNFPIKVTASAAPFNFDDLTSFLSATDILKGNVVFNLDAEGEFGDFAIRKLSTKIGDTELRLTGRMRKLHTPDKMYIDAKVGNSSADYADVLALLPTLSIPKYKNLSMKNMNFVYSGEPQKFSAQGGAELGDGSFDFDVFMDLTKKTMEYDAKIETKNLDAFPAVGTPTKLNSSFSIAGKGTDATDLETEFDVKIKNSFYGDLQIDSLSLASKAEENILSLKSSGLVNGAKFKVGGLLNFTDVAYPFYNLSGRLEHFNIDSFVDSLYMPSNLNFDFYANGKYLDINKTIGKFHVQLDSSKIRDDLIVGSKVDLFLDKKKNNRTINLHSDFVDFFVEGKYKILDVFDLLNYQLSTSGEIIYNKIQTINPLKDSLLTFSKYDSVIVNKNIDLKYSFNFKDFSLFKTLLGNDKLDIAGKGEGNIKNDSLKFSIDSKLSLNHLVLKKGKKLTFFSGISTDFNLRKSNLPDSLANINGDFSFLGKRLYFGSDITNVKMNLKFLNSSIAYDVAGNLSEDLRTEIRGAFNIQNGNEILRIDSLTTLFRDLKWTNSGPGYLRGTKDTLFVKNINLNYGNSTLQLNGFIAEDSSDLKFDIKKINLQLLEYVLTGTATDSLHAEIDGFCSLNGNLEDPLIKLKLSIPWITIGNTKFGSFICDVNYRDEVMTPNIRFTALKDTSYKLLHIYGKVPINLSAKSDKPFVPIKRNIDLEIMSSKFNLANLGNILPYISRQRGILQTNIHVGGTLNSPDVNGSIRLDDILFRLRATNLDYRLNTQIEMRDGSFAVNNFELQNAGNSRHGGVLKGGGSIEFGEDGIDSMEFKLNGKLAILSPVSKQATRFIAGDLALGSDGDWTISYRDKRFYLQGNIDILEADLEYTSPQTGYSSNDNEFIYKTVIDSANVDFNELDFQNLISTIASDDKKEEEESPFDFKLKIRTVNDVKFTVDLAKAFNQKLVLFISGEMLVENIEGVTNTQGSLKLLDGSRLEFFKNFQATGDIRFEKNLTDPYLDITASYLGDYVSSLDPFQQTKEVAVKLHLKGPLSEIGKELVLDKNKFAVYVGRKDIESNIPSSQYDASDALTFILVNKFKEDLTAANKEDIAGQTSAAGLVIGPVISSFLNSTIGGGIIQDIQISQAGQYTRIGISGNYENLRYRIGGTTEALSDISKANILIQYFFTRDFSLRLERRYPIIYSEGTDERVNEAGLRYKFEF